MAVAGREERARGAFDRRMWGDAFADLSAAHREAPLDAEDLERLALSAYMVGKDDASEEAWIAAHHAWLRRGQPEHMRKRHGLGVCAAVAVVALVAAAIASAGPSSRQVQMLDNCDGPTLDAAIGPGTCARNDGLEFDTFIGRLIERHAVESWRFSPDHLSLEAGGEIMAVNAGGEFHTFTPVAQFGGGCVAALNALLGLTPVPECGIPGILGATGAGPGGSVTTAPVTAGTHKFMCLIHPWMRATVDAG